jgi:hypothetical protein
MKEIIATPRECSQATRITSMSRLAMYRRVLRLLVKVRTLETELKAAKLELWSHAGWQSQNVDDGNGIKPNGQQAAVGS